MLERIAKKTNCPKQISDSTAKSRKPCLARATTKGTITTRMGLQFRLQALAGQ